MPTSEELKEHIASISSTLQQLQSTLNNLNSTSGLLQPANVKDPLLEISKLSSLISTHATKLGLVFKPPIAATTYNTCFQELDSFFKYIKFLISILNQLKNSTESYSNLFINELSYNTASIIESAFYLVEELGKLIDTEDVLKDDKTDERLIGVGIVWEKCENISKNAKIGSSGILRGKLKSSSSLVLDASEELKEWLLDPMVGDAFNLDDFSDNFDGDDDKIQTSNNGDEDESGDEDEDEDVPEAIIKYGETWSPKIQLVKLFLSLLDRSIPASKYTKKFSKNIDLFHEKQLKVNEYVDDLVASIVYDMDLENAKKASDKLTKEINQIFEIVKILNNNDEKKVKWLESWKIKYSN